MKMAKASEADLRMAMELCSALDALTDSWPTMPAQPVSSRLGRGECEEFDRDDDRQCGIVLRHLLDIAERASLMRVIWGAAVMLDPQNEMVDPEADTLEHHPKRQQLQAEAEHLRAKVEALQTDSERLDWLTFNLPGSALQAIGVQWGEHAQARFAIDAAMGQKGATA